jgi:hypothetical protein
VPQIALPQATKAQAAFRLSVGGGAILLPKLSARLFGFRKEDITDGAIGIAAMFGVRELVIGGITIATVEDEPERIRRLLMMNIAVDAADALAMLWVARRHPGARRAAFLILPAAIGSVIANAMALQEVPAT